MKRPRGLLLPVLLALVLIFAASPLVQAQAVTVTVDAPAQVSAGSAFTVPVNITSVVDFDAAVLRVRFDPAILSLTSVTDGNIGGTIIPIAALVEIESGLWGITANVPGFPGVTGSGYLMELHFSALAPGTSAIDLENHSLSDKDAQEIPATWVDDSVNVIAGANPTIAFDPTTFSFTATQDSANPSNQTLDVWNSSSGTLDWLVDDDGAWLILAPTSGDSTSEHDVVTLSVDISGLTAGAYNATITITAAGATNTPQTVPVSLTVSSVGGGGGGGGGGGVGGVDRTAPRLSDISASGITETTADIYWKTQERSDNQVEYWASPSMFSELDEEMVINHHVRLTGLTPGTTYYYKALSRDRAGNLSVWEFPPEEYTFTTFGEAPAAAFASSDLSLSPSEVDIGEMVTISVTVANTGNASSSYKVTLKIDNAVVDTKTVTLAGGASQTVPFTTSKDVAGTYRVDVDRLSGSFTVKTVPVSLEPAALTTSDLTISPTEIETGKIVTISTRVTNTGDLIGSYEVTLKIDNAVIDTKTVTLAGGASQTVTFTVDQDTAGIYAVDVDGLSGTFTVKTVPLPAKPINWPLIGGIIAAVVVGLGVFFWMRRRAAALLICEGEVSLVQGKG